MGFLRSPKRAIYNKIYNKTTFSLTDIPKLIKVKQSKKEKKPEWLIQENKNKDFFNSENGLSPINFLREKAKKYQKDKRFQKAEELYKKIANMSRMGFDYCDLGDTFYKQNKFEEAIKSYKEAIKLEPIAPYPKRAIEKIKRKIKKRKI